MADLIDRAALGIGRANPHMFDKPEYAGGWNSAVEIIQNAPAVDAVEVVRCKDCRWRDSMACPLHLSELTSGGRWLPLDEDFCSYGERKET